MPYTSGSNSTADLKREKHDMEEFQEKPDTPSPNLPNIQPKKSSKNVNFGSNLKPISNVNEDSSSKHLSSDAVANGSQEINQSSTGSKKHGKNSTSVKLEITSSAFNNGQKSADPPKIIMLPDSIQTTTNPQKRRRVVRACDRCRKLKIKCSGDLPCIHCTVYSYECTYDQPNRSKRRNVAVAVPASKERATSETTDSTNISIDSKKKTPKLASDSHSKGALSLPKSVSSHQALEKLHPSTVSTLASLNPELFSKLTDRLKLYDDILHRLLPEIKLTDLNDNPKPINPMKLMSALNKMRDAGKSVSKSSSKQIAKMYDSLPEMPLPNLPITKLPPTYMNNAQQQLSRSSPAPVSKGNIHSRLQNSRPSTEPPIIPYPGIDGSLESSMGKEIKIILPSREVALDLITKTWENACVLFRFYHRVAFIEDLNELYDTDPNQYTNKQQRFLPLVYSVMACGALFYKSDENTNFNSSQTNTDSTNQHKREGSENVASGSASPMLGNSDYIQRKDFEDEGYKYFIAARKLIDITDTRDTYGIQTIVMLIIFLQCSARLSTCYAYIGIALRAALREGLHRKLDYPFNPIELEIRKRLFWTIYKMDIYVNTMLGLPRTISSDDFDQDMPIELDDENITVNGYRYDRQGDRLSSSGIANAHTRLIFLMKEVVTKLYPIKPKKSSNFSDEYSEFNENDSSSKTGNNQKNKADLIRNNFVYDLELKLQDWMNSLPLELKPGVEPPGQYLKANRLLHISYLHVKIILYRPFIHYISANVVSQSLNDLACIEKAKNCINVARLVVKLAEDMIDKNMLSGSYWFSIYTIFFSVACLVYYVHFAPSLNKDGKPSLEYVAIKRDAENGKRVLDVLKDSSMAARRTYNILNALFEQLNRKTAGASANKSHDYQAQFVPAHMGTSEYATQHQQHVKTENHVPNQSASQEQNKYPRQRDEHYTDLKAKEEKGSNMMDNQNYYNSAPPTQDALKNSTSRRSFDSEFINKDVNGQSLTPIISINNANNNSMDVNIPKRAVFNDITDYKYVPGPMDQMDMKIFGRFLPPYMLNNNGKECDNSENIETPLASQNNNSSSENANNSKGDSRGHLLDQSFQLFEFGDKGKQGEGFNNYNANVLNDTPKPEISNVELEGNEDSKMYSSADWINNEIIESTDDFFNQVTTANAIPSGLSTVFQSESDKTGTSISNANAEGRISTGEKSNTPSRLVNMEGIGMLDELFFGSSWDKEINGDDKDTKF